MLIVIILNLFQFTPENIDPHSCTHLVYSFAKLDGNKINVSNYERDIEREMYKKFNDLKNKNPHLKTMIGIGGWSEESAKYSKMTKNIKTRKEFINSVTEFIFTHKFDGLDFNWYAITYEHLFI